MNSNQEIRRGRETKPLKVIWYHNHDNIALAILAAPAIVGIGYLHATAEAPAPLASWGLMIALIAWFAYNAYFAFFPNVFIKPRKDSFDLHLSSLRNGTHKLCIKFDEVVEISVEGLQHETEGFVHVDLDYTNYYLRLKTRNRLDLPTWVADAIQSSKEGYKRFRNDPDCVLMWHLGVVTPNGLDKFVALLASRKRPCENGTLPSNAQ